MKAGETTWAYTWQCTLHVKNAINSNTWTSAFLCLLAPKTQSCLISPGETRSARTTLPPWRFLFRSQFLRHLWWSTLGCRGVLTAGEPLELPWFWDSSQIRNSSSKEGLGDAFPVDRLCTGVFASSQQVQEKQDVSLFWRIQNTPGFRTGQNKALEPGGIVLTSVRKPLDH